MLCPECNNKSQTIDSRIVELNVFRKRRCKECGHIFYTEEIEIDDIETVRDYLSAIKRNQRERYKQNIFRGIAKR